MLYEIFIIYYSVAIPLAVYTVYDFWYSTPTSIEIIGTKHSQTTCTDQYREL